MFFGKSVILLKCIFFVFELDFFGLVFFYFGFFLLKVLFLGEFDSFVFFLLSENFLILIIGKV